ncbi:hypothetical protein SAMN05421823_104149 [Catalinimonas alkaloidigena]|uniref:Uncharacterized protein n=1 Tax=Catalinimonas alkaloidigena TaxID=1075417 RepID=A0A1G9GMG6_9BACT|nr:hypothetical protein [Catalinimonas alkaloidigena]SDL01483.1 hypothetical protein SAMN05421823_104149 [Catalinimonas alkaloidigena]
MLIKCHFFTDDEIENDVDPREVRSLEDHQRLLDYMIRLSTLLDQPVILTPENTPDLIHMRGYQEQVDLSNRRFK